MIPVIFDQHLHLSHFAIFLTLTFIFLLRLAHFQITQLSRHKPVPPSCISKHPFSLLSLFLPSSSIPFIPPLLVLLFLCCAVSTSYLSPSLKHPSTFSLVFAPPTLSSSSFAHCYLTRLLITLTWLPEIRRSSPLSPVLNKIVFKPTLF